MLFIIAPPIILASLFYVSKLDKKHITNMERKITCFALAISFLVYSFLCIRYEIMYLSPHNMYTNSSESKLTTQLMNCARTYIPGTTESWNKIEKCMNRVEHYHISKGRTPYFQNIPTAFVFRIDQDSIFTTPYYDKMSLVDKALVMIHECSHISIGTIDHAYVWQRKYFTLSPAQHLENADSYTAAVARECTNSSYIM
tara:strand:- start:606 stop:1202 length:597 start_codon:yes stop_codon:yes gene_type:complete